MVIDNHSRFSTTHTVSSTKRWGTRPRQTNTAQRRPRQAKEGRRSRASDWVGAESVPNDSRSSISVTYTYKRVKNAACVHLPLITTSGEQQGSENFFPSSKNQAGRFIEP